MKRSAIIFLSSALIAAAPGANAQSTYYWAASAPQYSSGAKTYFPMGTPVLLRTRSEVNTKQMRPGDRVYFEVAENLTYRNQIVLPVGSPAFGEVVRSERNGMLGKRGEIEIRLLYAETPYGPVRLGGGTAAQGKDATVWSVAGAMFVAWPFIFVHGTSGYVRAGSTVPGHLSEPLTFNAVSPTSQSARAEPVGPDPVERFPAQSNRAATGDGGPLVASR